MAIDSAAKRNSALLDPGNLPWPPDGTIAVGDRLVMLEFYSGIAAEELIPTRTIYRPNSANPPVVYNPVAGIGPVAYFPGSSPPSQFYRPENASTPAS